MEEEDTELRFEAPTWMNWNAIFATTDHPAISSEWMKDFLWDLI